MKYKDIQTILKCKKISFNSLAEFMDMSNKGLKYSLENETLPVSKIKKLCEILEITTSQFIGEIKGCGNIVGNNIIDNRQFYSDSPDVLRAKIDLLEERIKEKDNQIKEKDNQIKELLNALKSALNK